MVEDKEIKQNIINFRKNTIRKILRQLKLFKFREVKTLTIGSIKPIKGYVDYQVSFVVTGILKDGKPDKKNAFELVQAYKDDSKLVSKRGLKMLMMQLTHSDAPIKAGINPNTVFNKKQVAKEIMDTFNGNKKESFDVVLDNILGD